MALPNLFLLALHPLRNRPDYYVCGLSDQSTHLYLILLYKYIESIFFFFIPIVVQVSLHLYMGISIIKGTTNRYFSN
jgi:hypothetical protein